MPRFEGDNYARNLVKLHAARDIAAALGCGVPELALAWVLAQGEHVVAIPGTTSIGHLEQNFRALRVELSEPTLARLNELFAPDSIAGNRYSDAMQQSIDTERFPFEAYSS